ncbi:MAG: penicillin-binding protein [Bacteroidota bacterium]|nr:penicillin-binding protein [Bacteroidota bacterium]
MENRKRNINWRLVFLYFFMSLFALVILSQVVVIQQVKDVFSQNQPEFINVQAPRGNIFSDDESLLAISMPLYDLHIDFKTIHADTFQKYITQLTIELASFFEDKTALEYELLFRHQKKKKSQYFLLKKNVTYNEIKQIKAFPLFNKGQHQGGLIFERKENREKPFKLLAKRTIGSVRKDIKPIGIEGAYNQTLKGKDGKKLVQRISKKHFLPISSSANILPKAGDDVISTINIDLQDVAEQALKNTLEKHKADFGCVAVMEVKTGAIKAIANLKRTEEGFFKESYNYMIGEHVEPGSTFKLASVLAGLEDGVFNLSDSVDTENGRYQFYDRTMYDSRKGGYGKITIGDAFVVSSNVGISKVINNAYAKQAGKFVDRLFKLQLNSPLDIEIPTPDNPRIKTPKDTDWSGTTLPWMSIGYEVSLTPLHMLTFYNAIANNGKMLKPLFVEGIKRNGKFIEQNKTITINPSICAKSNIAQVIPLMVAVVENENGTATNIRSKQYKIAGKTGTSQLKYWERKEGEESRYQASFAGFFPADNPKYSCIVLVNNPTENGFYGGTVAAPVFKEIADKVFASDLDLHQAITAKANKKAPYTKNGYNEDVQFVLNELRIPIDTEDATWIIASVKAEKVALKTRKIEQDLKNGLIPSLKGMGIQDALFLLENNGLQVHFSGKGVIKSQSLKKGEQFKNGSKIILELA